MTFTAEGIFTAMVTPFTADGALDLAVARKAVAWQIEQGVHGIVPLGGTGEPLSLTVDEQKRLIDAVVDEAGSRAPVVAGAARHHRGRPSRGVRRCSSRDAIPPYTTRRERIRSISD